MDTPQKIPTRQMWTLLTSLKLEQRKQVALLETLVISDSDLREHLVSIGAQTLGIRVCFKTESGLLAPLLLGRDITLDDGVYVEDLIYSGVYEVYQGEKISLVQRVMDSNVLFRGVDSLFLVIHLALIESGADTAEFLEEAEVLLGSTSLVDLVCACTNINGHDPSLNAHHIQSTVF